MRLGSSTVSQLKVGSSSVSKLYIGSTEYTTPGAATVVAYTFDFNSNFNATIGTINLSNTGVGQPYVIQADNPVPYSGTGCLKATGSGARLSSSGYSLANMTTFTVECYVYRPSTWNGYQTILNLAESGGYRGFHLYYSGVDESLAANNGNSESIQAGTIPVAQWTKVAFVYNNGTNNKLLINDSVVGTGSQSVLAGPWKINVGNIDANWGGTETFYSNMCFDNLTISNAALY